MPIMTKIPKAFQKFVDENENRLKAWMLNPTFLRVARRDSDFFERACCSNTEKEQIAFQIEANHRVYGKSLNEVLPVLQSIEAWKEAPTTGEF